MTHECYTLFLLLAADSGDKPQQGGPVRRAIHHTHNYLPRRPLVPLLGRMQSLTPYCKMLVILMHGDTCTLAQNWVLLYKEKDSVTKGNI